MEDQLGTKQTKVGHGHINNQCEWTTCHFSFSDGFHQLSAETEEQIFHVNMEKIISKYELGQKMKPRLLLRSFGSD